MTEQEKKHFKGFNAGYMIEQQYPELASQLVANIKDVETSFTKGFVEGSKEAIQEKEMPKSKAISKLRSLQKNIIPRPTKQRNKERGFDLEK
jgi:hypothetical protein